MSLNPDGTVFSEVEIGAAQLGFSTTNDGVIAMGFSIDSLGDLDGNGTIEVAVSAFWRRSGSALASQPRGGLAIVSINSSLAVAGSQVIALGVGGFTGSLADGDQFGCSVTAIGDINGDGVPDLAVGSWLDDDGGPNRGAVYILFLNANATVASHQKISGVYAKRLD